jgi:hypothetical protein
MWTVLSGIRSWPRWGRERLLTVEATQNGSVRVSLERETIPNQKELGS